MKRKLALVMATAVIAGTVPAIPAHAATDNRVTNVVTVKEDSTVGNSTLVIKNDKKDIVTDKAFYIELQGGEAEWPEQDKNTGIFSITDDKGVKKNVSLTTSNKVSKIERISDELIKVTIGSTALVQDEEIRISLDDVKTNSAKGELKVEVRGEESGVTSGTYTYAIVSGSDSLVARILGDKKTVTRGDNTGATMEVKELAVDSFQKDKVLKFKLPTDMKWVGPASSATTKTVISGLPGVSGTDYDITLANDDRELVVTYKNNVAATTKEVVTVTPVFNVTKDAKLGDVEVNVDYTDGVSNSSLIVAEYKEYGMTVKVDKVPEIVAGNKETKADYKVKLTFEGPKESLLLGRDMDFEIVNGDVKGSSIPSDFTDADGIKGKYDDEFSLTVAKNSNDKYTLEFYVKADLDVTGDVKMKINGAGIDKQEVVIAKAISTVNVEAKKGDGKLADVRIGVQNQEAPVLTFTETKKESLKKGFYYLKMDKSNGVQFDIDSAKIKVVEGNIDVDFDVLNSGSLLEIEVKGESTKPSKFTIEGLKLDLDRTVPEGTLKAALVTNDESGRLAEGKGYWLDKDGNLVSSTDPKAKDYRTVGDNKYWDDITKFDLINVVTAAPGANKTTTVFTLDNAKFTVMENGVAVEKTMDAAPAVVDGRALLPIRYVANALGVKDDAILWDNATRTATFFKGDRVVKMTLGSKTLIVNGTPVEMEVAPVVKNGRAMVPVRALANAFGVNLNWDDAAKTITVEY